MSHDPEQTLIFHITDVENLGAILAAGGLYSDAVMVQRRPVVIGYPHIKQRRLTKYRVDCCGNRFVGEFVPFYFCPRSPMLFAVNSDETGRGTGAQRSVVHLVSTVARALSQNRPWAISDGNAGAGYALFSSRLASLAELDWEAIEARYWQGKQTQKSAEFLVADFFDWTGVTAVGCHNPEVLEQVQNLLLTRAHRPPVRVEPSWYY
jgi:hypothetical protein